jgi:hypothetical protein
MDVPGSYLGEYAGGSENFVIKADGTFVQTFTRGALF